MKNIWQQLSRCLLICLLVSISSFSLAQSSAYWLYTLQENENLWSFSNKHLVSPAYALRLQNLNKIPNPYQIRPNTQIKVPFEWVKHVSGHAKVSALSGDAFLIVENGSKQPLTVGQTVQTGSSLETGKNSQATLRFMDGSLLTMSSETNLKLGSQIYYPVTGASKNEIKLEKGRISSKIEHPPLMRNQYEVTTPSSVTAVRGTELLIGIGQDQETLTSVYSGKVSMIADNKDQAIEAGFGGIAGKGKETTKEALPLPPPLDQLPTHYKYNTPVLSWSAMPNAASYNVQIYQADKAMALMQEGEVKDTTTLLQALPNGTYKVTIASVTASGLAGKTNQATFDVTGNPMPPLIVYPLSNDYSRTKKVELNIGNASSHAGYIIELAKDQNFTQDVQQQPIKNEGKTFYFELPDNNVWYWRLAAVDQQKQQGMFTDPRKIEVSILRAPLSSSTAIDSFKIPFDGVQYQLSIFDLDHKTVFEKTQSTPNWNKLNLPIGEYQAQVSYILNGKIVYQMPKQTINWR